MPFTSLFYVLQNNMHTVELQYTTDCGGPETWTAMSLAHDIVMTGGRGHTALRLLNKHFSCLKGSILADLMTRRFHVTHTLVIKSWFALPLSERNEDVFNKNGRYLKHGTSPIYRTARNNGKQYIGAVLFLLLHIYVKMFYFDCAKGSAF